MIGRLAIHGGFGGRELGYDLFGDAFRRIGSALETIGIAAVSVRVEDDVARKFCMSCEVFLGHPAESQTHFLPIETLEAALGAPADEP